MRLNELAAWALDMRDHAVTFRQLHDFQGLLDSGAGLNQEEDRQIDIFFGVLIVMFNDPCSPTASIFFADSNGIMRSHRSPSSTYVGTVPLRKPPSSQEWSFG